MASNRSRAALGLAALALFSIGLSQDRSAMQWLEKAIRASDDLKVSGVREVAMPAPRAPGVAQPPPLVELYSQRGSTIRIDYPSTSRLAGQSIVETPKERRHYFPRERKILVSPAREEGRLEFLRKLVKEKSMRVTSERGEPIAGRSTVVLAFSGAEGRLSQKLWLDSENAFVLKRELSGPRGRAWAYEFTRVDFNPQLGKRDFELPDVPKITPESRMKELVSESNGEFKLRKLDSGSFRLESANVFPMGPRRALAMSYSGSSGRVTLFQMKERLNERDLERIRRGANLVSWSEDGRFFVLVGNLPEPALRRLAGI